MLLSSLLKQTKKSCGFLFRHSSSWQTHLLWCFGWSIKLRQTPSSVDSATTFHCSVLRSWWKRWHSHLTALSPDPCSQTDVRAEELFGFLGFFQVFLSTGNWEQSQSVDNRRFGLVSLSDNTKTHLFWLHGACFVAIPSSPHGLKANLSDSSSSIKHVTLKKTSGAVQGAETVSSGLARTCKFNGTLSQFLWSRFVLTAQPWRDSSPKIETFCSPRCQWGLWWQFLINMAILHKGKEFDPMPTHWSQVLCTPTEINNRWNT